MRLSLTEPGYLKVSIAVISELVNEARFKITPDGLELVAMDPANVAMVIFKLLSSCFSEYDVKNNIEIGINLNNLKQILRRAKPNDKLTLELMPDQKLQITLKSNTTRTFNLAILELEDKDQKIPELEFPVSIKMSSSSLSESIEDVGIVAESVSFEAEPNKFTVKAEGDLSRAQVEIPSDEGTNISVQGDKFRSKYSIEYLKKIMNGGKLADTVEILFNQDYPLRVDYKVVDKVLLSFILAPRVEND